MQSYVRATLKIFLGTEEMSVEARFSGSHMPHKCPWSIKEGLRSIQYVKERSKYLQAPKHHFC